MHIHTGRYTADIDGDFVVFLIGMRFDSGDVGIWHETYRVRAGEYETVYGNMPTYGLAAASRSVPIARKAQTSAARIGATSTDEPAVEPY
jgi:hypothetical protein